MRTAPVGDDSSFNFAVVGGSGGKGQLAVANLLGSLEPDLILRTGDVVYPVGEERYYDRRFFAPLPLHHRVGTRLPGAR